MPNLYSETIFIDYFSDKDDENTYINEYAKSYSYFN